MNRLRIGLIAPEFPPAHGGMENMAAGMAAQLARSAEVTVYTRPGNGVTGAAFALVPRLERRLDHDEGILANEPIDVWLSLNAGYAALAGRLSAPMCAYLVGNDFLNPWVGFRNRWLDTMARTPGIWRSAQTMVRRRRQAAIRAGLRSTRHIFALSSATASLIGKVYPGHADMTSIVPPGVDDEFFQEREHRSRDGVLHLLSVCRLTQAAARKNVDGVIRALAAVPFDVDYTVVGDGDDRARLEALAAETRRPGCEIRFVGALDRHALLSAYRKTDLFVLPVKASAADVEGFGIVYLEATAAGVPVLASRAGLATDAVAEGRNGALLDEATPEAIARGLTDFLRDRSRYPPDQVRAVAEPFRWQRIGDAILSVLDAERTR